MGMKARTIEGFRGEMMKSISTFYARRGLSGASLHAFARKLQTITDEMRAAGESKDDIKKALAAEQAHLLRVEHQPIPEPLLDGTFLSIDAGGLTEAERALSPDRRVALTTALLQKAYSAMIQGSIGAEGHYAGLGTRLEPPRPKPKFTMTAEDLLDGLQVFDERTRDSKYKDEEDYQALREQIEGFGGMAAISARFKTLQEWTIGERIFIAKIYDVYSLAASKFGITGDGFGRILRSLKFKIIVNAGSGGEIIENFVKRGFFGLDPRNVIFMNQAQHPTLEVKEDGSLAPDGDHLSQGNHGLIPLQANLDGQWFMVVPDNSQKGYRTEDITTTDYKDFQSGITALVVESVEDTTQYVKPYDYTYLSYVEKLGRELGIPMFMKIVGQRKYPQKPQKGGFIDTRTSDTGARRNVVIESNRAPSLEPKDIRLLNLNRNAFYNPNEVDDVIMEGPMIEDLHPTFEPQGSDMKVRIDPKIPQGDRNLYLDKVMYLMDDPPQTISNLKDPRDILPTLVLMQRMEIDPELIRFADERLGLGPSRAKGSFGDKTQAISLEQFNVPQFLAGLTTTARENLIAAFELCEVTGSLVRRYEIADDGAVFIETIPGTMLGDGSRYPSRAMSRIKASDSKAFIAREGNKLYIGPRYGFDVIDIPNKRSGREGEIITLIIKFKDAPREREKEKERKEKLFSKKIERILQLIADGGIVLEESVIREYVLSLPAKDLLMLSAAKIAEMVIENFKLAPR